VASKRKWRKRAHKQLAITDDLFTQVSLLSGQLSRVDEILTTSELPGPTIDAWSMQVRDLLTTLLKERGIISGGVHRAFAERSSAPPLRPRNEVPDSGEYELLTPQDLRPFKEEDIAILRGVQVAPDPQNRFDP
jgi:hypothetical protein